MGKNLSKNLCVFIFGFLLPSLAFAAGLGRLTVSSGLGQPLRAEIEVFALQPGEADTLTAVMGSVDAFRRANIDYNAALQSIRFTIERRPNNQFVIALSSTQPMNEPFIDMLVELSWSTGRLLREYTFLLDPPELKPVASAPILPVVPPTATALPVEAPKPVAAPVVVPEAPRAPVAAPTAPVAKPAPRAAARPAAAPAAAPAEKSYEVKRGDTLSGIAAQNMVPGVSMQQMLAALYRSNEAMFDGKNMNRLRTGRILNLPSAEEVQGISQSEAVQLVRSQSVDYAEYQRSVGAAVTAAPERAEGTRQAAGRITAPAADKPAAKAAEKDQLRLSKPDDAKGASKAAAAAGADDAAASSKALREANDRVALLEKNVKDLLKLLELKSGTGAQAQKQAEASKAAPAKPEAAKPEAIKPEAIKPETVKPETVKPEAAKAEPAKPEAAKAEPTAPAPVTPADATKGAEPAKPAAEGGAAVDVAKAAPKPAPKAPPPPPPEPPSFLDELLDNEFLLPAAGGVVLLLAGYAGFAWRRKKRATATNFADSAMGAASGTEPSIASSAIVAAAGFASAAEPEDQGASAAASGGGEEIDPIAEADVYMAYGRDTQAEEILKEALSKDASRTAVWLKLMEIYVNRKDLPSCESTAMDLQTLTGGQGADWNKAQALGMQVDPSNSLYGGSGTAADSAMPDHSATQILPRMGSTQVIEPVTDATAAGSALDFDLDLGAETPVVPAAAGVDLDLSAEAPAADAGPGDAGELTGSGLDFDLGTDTETAAEEPQATPAEAGAGMDFDLSLGDALPLPEAELPAEPAAEGSGIDFYLDMGDSPALPELPETAPANDAGQSADIDMSALSFDLDSGGEAASAPANMDAKWQEVATKLDLAKVYDEMGDKDGARDLLTEVLNEGDAMQKQQAKTMMEAMG